MSDQFERYEKFDQRTTEAQRRQYEDRLRNATDADKPFAQWQERGVIDVPVRDLPNIDDIQGSQDFKKISEAEMVDGLHKLSLMKSDIDQGPGRSSDYWRKFDEQEGLDHANGYQRVYDAFYGGDAIRLNKIGDQYEVINGRHRIWLAQQLGYNALPASVNELR